MSRINFLRFPFEHESRQRSSLCVVKAKKVITTKMGICAVKMCPYGNYGWGEKVLQKCSTRKIYAISVFQWSVICDLGSG